METTSSGRKSWLVALVLSIFLGPLGADRFYLGKVATGVLKLITGGGLGIWWLIDVYLIATNQLFRPLPCPRPGRLNRPSKPPHVGITMHYWAGPGPVAYLKSVILSRKAAKNLPCINLPDLSLRSR